MAGKIKIFLKLSAACIFLLSGAAKASAGVPYGSPVHNVIWAGELHKQVAFLADSLCQGRATGSRGNVEAGFWIASEFARYGLLPLGGDGRCCGTSYARHCLLPDGRFGHNFAAMLPGSVKSPRDSYVIVGAHYDHIGTIGGKMYPGADSNASGTVAMLNLAKMFTTMKIFGNTWSSSIIFVAFDAKELSMGGSAAFWRDIEEGHLTDPLTGKTVTADKVKFMVNIDQVGGVSEPLHKGKKNYLIMLGNDSLPKDRRGLAEYCNRTYGTALDLGFSYYGSARFTELFYKLGDQRVFVEHKKPAVLFTSGITMMTNKPSDTAESLDYEVLRQRIIFIFHWLDRIL